MPESEPESESGPESESPPPSLARINKRGCFIILIVLAIALAAIAFVALNAPPQPSGDIPTM